MSGQLVFATLFTLAGGAATLLTVMTLRRRQLVPGLLARKLMHMATVTLFQRYMLPILFFMPCNAMDNTIGSCICIMLVIIPRCSSIVTILGSCCTWCTYALFCY
jgi:hypothetical protein